MVMAFIMVVWFESDIVQTISKLTNTRSLLKISDFEKYKLEVDIMSNYPNFLYEKYPGYLTKLLSCPICLCFWLTVAQCTLKYNSLTELVFMFGLNYFINLTIYLLVKKLYDNK